MPSRQKVSSTRVPSCQRCTVVTRAPRGLTFSVNVISLGTDSSGRESSAANLFGIRLSDRPSDRRVETGAAMNAGDLPDGQDAPSADSLYLWDTQHLKSIECLPQNEGVEHLSCRARDAKCGRLRLLILVYLPEKSSP